MLRPPDPNWRAFQPVSQENDGVTLWGAIGIIAVIVALVSLPFVLAGCAAEQLQRTEDAARVFAAASTQPSATDLFPFGTEVKLALGAVAGAVITLIGLWRRTQSQKQKS